MGPRIVLRCGGCLKEEFRAWASLRSALWAGVVAPGFGGSLSWGGARVEASRGAHARSVARDWLGSRKNHAWTVYLRTDVDGRWRFIEAGRDWGQRK